MLHSGTIAEWKGVASFLNSAGLRYAQAHGKEKKGFIV